VKRRQALAISLAALVAACKPRGRRGGPARVVSIAPSTTEMVFAIGAGDALVGRSRYCDYPPEALKLPVVGGFADPSVEAVLALEPTLVVGARGPAGPALEDALHAHGIDTYFPEPESLAQIEGILIELGRRLDHEAGAKKAVEVIAAKRAAVEAMVRGRPRVRAVLLFDVSPIVAAGPGSFPDELLRIAGADNLITEGGKYPTLPLERLIAIGPDVILDGSVGEHEPVAGSRVLALRDAPGWSGLSALKGGHVRALSASEALRPGPRIGDGLELMARALRDAGGAP
jgi:iron complex transport system substrate-binding protein